MSRWRALLRLARRDARRDRARTLLVIVAVALPVAALAGLVLITDTLTPTPQERAVEQVGRADAVAWVSNTVGEAADDPVADLGRRVAPDVELEPIRSLPASVSADGPARRMQVSDERLDDEALAVGRLELVDGRPPRADDEVAVTRAVARILDVALGDRLSLAVSDGHADGVQATTDAVAGERRVVGISERPERLGARGVQVAPGTLDELPAHEILLRSPGDRPVQVDGDDVDIEGGDVPTAVRPGDEPTWTVTTSESVVDRPQSRGERITVVLLGGLAAVQVALIAGASFAVSVRRRQRELGLLATVGGRRSDVRRTVLLTGSVGGVVGAVTGLALAVLVVLAAAPWYDQLAGRRVGGIALDPVWLAVPALLAVVATVVGAWWPARSVARLPITVALSGRRPTPRPSRRGVAIGLVLVAGGATGLAALAGLTVGGGRPVPGQVPLLIRSEPVLYLAAVVLIVLGAGLTSPWLLERIGRLAPRLTVGARLAVRDAARFRTRNGPLVTAGMAALAGAITVASLLGSLEQQAQDRYTPGLGDDELMIEGDRAEEAAAAIAERWGSEPVELPRVGAFVAPTAMSGAFERALPAGVTVATPETLRTMTGDADQGTPPDDAAIVVLPPDGADGPATADGVPDTIVLQVSRSVPAGAAHETDEVELPATAVVADAERSGALLPTVAIPETLLEEHDVPVTGGTQTGGTEEPAGRWLLRFEHPVGDDLAEAAAALATATVGDAAHVQVEGGPPTPWTSLRALGLALGLIAGLAIVAVAVALAAAEARSDLRTLTAVGADRRTRRRLAVGRALVLCGLASALAVPVGMLPPVLLAGVVAAELRVHVPWVTLGVVLIVVPALVALGAAAAARREPSPLARAA